MHKKIVPAQLRVGMFITKIDGNWLDHPFWRRSFLVENEEVLKTVRASGVTAVWIDTASGIDVAPDVDPDGPGMAPAGATVTDTTGAAPAAPTAPAAPMLRRAAASEDLPRAMERARALCEAARDQVVTMFEDVRMGRALDPASVRPLVREIADSVTGNATAILSIARLKTHDDYTYMHSAAVCALMVALARELGLSEEESRIAGLGGLLHDLGKAFMPLEILNKPGKLTDEEFSAIKGHPVAGHRYLSTQSQDDPSVLEVVLHHHEKLDGSGYPDGLAGESIPLLARLGAVCDVYDAITSDRPYKSGWDPAQAIRRMHSWSGHFDERVLKAFTKTVGIYPVGSLVRMKSGKLGVVAAPGNESLIRPKVKLFFSMRSKEPIAVELIDLSSPRCPDTIVGPEDPEVWGFTHLTQFWAP